MTQHSTPNTTTPRGGHVPVMLPEVLDALRPKYGAIYIDGTFGAGGYSSAILERAECQVWALDRDQQAIAKGAALVERFNGRLMLVEGCFGDMVPLLSDHIKAPVDGIVFDLGVSSMQLDQAERGFSLKHDGPLDMRMGAAATSGGHSQNAADVVMSLDEKDLSDIIFQLGEERKARQVARAIVVARQKEPIRRTGQLADIVRSVVRRHGNKRPDQNIDPATRTFQALRIYVNDELGELERGLAAAERLLGPGGRLVVVSFHSLEDRIAKNFLRARSDTNPRGSRHTPDALSPCQTHGEGRTATFTLLFKGAQKPSQRETDHNPRARSARLRAAIRTEVPVTSDGAGHHPGGRP
ncbi:MAG: 16S rRNA (cytosine(1402)-N(4))-methyltransferase RsmH [Pseudomonadota bacterium]